MKKIYLFLILLVSTFILIGCNKEKPDDNTIVGWDGKSVTYKAINIKNFGSATPAGTTNYNSGDDTVSIWNIDASLDNYGGIQTPTLTLDFSRAVIFKMEVISSYTQYIVKLAVEGESEYYYVLSDEGVPGVVSVNVVDAMLSDKYRLRNTQPNPGYNQGWKHAGTKKNCNFHILAKGPDGEKQTAELIIKSISVYNNQPAVTDIKIISDQLVDNHIEALKGSSGIRLQSTISPSTIVNKNVIWTSSNPDIASVSKDGFLLFAGVGETSIHATSEIDQSKVASIDVNVKSGYEDPTQLTDKLNSLNYQGNTSDLATFNDLYRTSWDTEKAMTHSLSYVGLDALDYRLSSYSLRVDNYFNKNNANDVKDAENNKNSNFAYADLSLGKGNATVYRNIAGKLYKEQYNGTLKFAYAVYNGTWEKSPSYQEQAIVIWNNGDIKKYEINVIATTLIADYSALDLGNTDLWTVPDWQKQSIDPIAHALSPARLTIESNVARIKQNKYPEAKYCFGGILSNILTVDSDNMAEIILDVHNLNQMNEFVKTMWELKIIYYDQDGRTVINSNPLKIASGNTVGLKTINFTPVYRRFRIYLVVNGSDIGAQFVDAQMEIRSLKMHTID
ncbi:MAG: Ig-like domain-containing protein [Bacilli bacterium]|nr:Ig-like domain-containing protein [Bacilli bacterium]